MYVKVTDSVYSLPNIFLLSLSAVVVDDDDFGRSVCREHDTTLYLTHQIKCRRV